MKDFGRDCNRIDECRRLSNAAEEPIEKLTGEHSLARLATQMLPLCIEGRDVTFADLQTFW